MNSSSAHVQDHDPRVGPGDVAEHRVVVDPDGPDDDEAHQVGDVRRPEGEERRAEPRAGLRHGDREDEQRDREREDAVAERLDPVRVHPGA